jgi:thymidylate synthase (FAD)
MSDMKKIDVHNGGHVTLVSYEASDLDVVNAARVSFNVTHDEMQPNDDKLIGYLMRNRHGSPFEHTFFKFRIRLPIFVAREWIRHRIGNSFNEVSGRYTEINMDWYVPKFDYIRKQTGKPGNYQYEQVDLAIIAVVQHMIESASESAFKDYYRMLDMGIAPELARIVLPVNAYTEWIWSVNARSLMAFLSLRAEEHAQREIQDYAYAVESIFREIMPATWQAWNDNGRLAP